MPERIRPHVLGVARRGDELLVAALRTPGGERFYRPPGGGIEFGERSVDAVVREFREELGAAVEPRGYLGTIENRFALSGERHHDLSLVHEVAFVDEAVYDRETLRGVDDGGAVHYEAEWATVADLRARDPPLYPEGLADVVDGDAVHVD